MILCDGKYDFHTYDDEYGDTLVCWRDGQPWRDFVEDKAVRALYDYACQLEERLAGATRELLFGEW